MLRWYADFPCEYDLNYFPFDTQVCLLEFKMRTATKQYVVIQPGVIEYNGKLELVEFLVTNWTIRDYDRSAQRDTKVSLSILLVDISGQLVPLHKSCRLC